MDLNVLDFCRGLFLRVGPNSRAWCEALEIFLDARKYKLATRVSHSILGLFGWTLMIPLNQDTLRRRFENAFRWYTSLFSATNKYIQDSIDVARSELHILRMQTNSPNGMKAFRD